MPCHALISTELDPYWNLAAEAQLLSKIEPSSSPLLFFWRSRPAVIIGKNQNPWRECNLDWMARQNVCLARRISGGGAVYHDLGNLNYAVFLPRETYDTDQVFERTVKALRHLGIPATRVDRTSLYVEGYKISGHAFCMRKHAVLHHGTLLVDADIESLRQALRPSEEWRIETKATASVRARVKNLSSCRTGVSIQEIQESLMRAWQCSAPADQIGDGWGGEQLSESRSEFASPEWLFDRTPDFCLSHHTATSGLDADIRFQVRKGHVVEQQGDIAAHPDWTGVRLPPFGELFG